MSNRITRNITRIGASGIFVGAAQAGRYYALSRKHGFDKWHWRSPYNWKPYKRQVVGLATTLKPSCIVEVGCGLGDIVSRIRAPSRFGIDIDSTVISAARQLHAGVTFEMGELPDVSGIVEMDVDLMVCVNWPEPDLFLKQIRLLCRKRRTAHLLVDCVIPSNKRGQNCLQPVDLESFGSIQHRESSVDEARDFYIVACHKP